MTTGTLSTQRRTSKTKHRPPTPPLKASSTKMDQVLETARRVEQLKDVRSRLVPCLPPPWALTGHQQTILAHLLPSSKLREKGEELNITLEQEDERLVTTYLRGRSKVAVYLFHGLGGHAESTYMQRTARLIRTMGHHVFLNNHRGCGAGAGLAVEPYHSGRAEDLAAVVEFGKRMLPGHRHIGVGFSLSANALLLLAAGVRAENPLDAVIAVNGPIDLAAAAKRLGQGLNLIYNFNFLNELKNSIRVRERTGRLKQRYSMKGIHTMRAFDDAYTAPAGGFKNRDDYYTTCSAEQYLPKIEIPTVLLTAMDDPFVGVEAYQRAELSDSTVLHVEKHGGHMGYLSMRTTPFGSRRWMDYALKEYLTALT